MRVLADGLHRLTKDALLRTEHLEHPFPNASQTTADCAQPDIALAIFESATDEPARKAVLLGKPPDFAIRPNVAHPNSVIDDPQTTFGIAKKAR